MIGTIGANHPITAHEKEASRMILRATSPSFNPHPHRTESLSQLWACSAPVPTPQIHLLPRFRFVIPAIYTRSSTNPTYSSHSSTNLDSSTPHCVQ